MAARENGKKSSLQLTVNNTKQNHIRITMKKKMISNLIFVKYN